MSGTVVARAALGFVLGAVMAVFLPPLAFAMALVMAGILGWARVRHQDVQPLPSLGGGFLAAVLAYLALAIVAALG